MEAEQVKSRNGDFFKKMDESPMCKNNRERKARTPMDGGER